MSIRVDLSELSTALADHDYAYLMTVTDDGRVHVVAITPSVTEGALRVDEVGRRSTANLAARPNISLVFPPRDVGGFSLIVDGDAAADGDAVVITPTTAVLHRPAPASGMDTGSSCGSDCQRIDLGSG